MLKIVSAAVVATGFLTLPAAAATVAELPMATVDYVEYEGFADLLIDNAAALIQDGPTDLFGTLSFSYDVASPYSDFFGQFQLTDSAFNDVVSGELTSAAYLNDELVLGFSNLTGSAAADFGALTLKLTFFDIFGVDPLSQLVSGESYDASAELTGQETPAPVPLPAGIVLLGSGIAALALRRRRA